MMYFSIRRIPAHVLNVILTAVVMVALLSPAQASEPKLLTSSGEWSGYTFEENGNLVCYMASTPKKAEGDYSKRGEIFALITHRPAEDTKNVFSYITGYSYKPGSEVELRIDSKKFTLFTQDDTAWAPDAETDDEIAEAVKKGLTMVVNGTSSRGTKTTDTFSLKGSTAVHNAISKECGIQ